MSTKTLTSLALVSKSCCLEKYAKYSRYIRCFQSISLYSGSEKTGFTLTFLSFVAVNLWFHNNIEFHCVYSAPRSGCLMPRDIGTSCLSRNFSYLNTTSSFVIKSSDNIMLFWSRFIHKNRIFHVLLFQIQSFCGETFRWQTYVSILVFYF